MANNKLVIKSAVREYTTRSFYNFFKYFWSSVEASEYEDNWHIEMVCNELQQRFEQYQENIIPATELQDLIFNLPPGCSKSLMVSVFFPAWVWLINPAAKIITYSYSYKVAEELSGKSLRLLMSEEYSEILSLIHI